MAQSGPYFASVSAMKRFQSILTSLIVLQVTMVLLLGVMTVLTYQNHADVSKMLTDSQKTAGNGENAKGPSAAWMAEVESRTGMRDPEAAKISQALNQQMAQANALDQQFNKLRIGTTAAAPPPVLSETAPHPPILSETTSLPTPTNESLTPAQRAIASLPAIANIVNYNEEWQFWTVDRGRFGGLKEGAEYAIRRQDNTALVGNVKITTLYPQESTVELVLATLKDPNVRPSVGDTLVDASKLQ